MQAILGIILSAILSENFILVKFYGICPFMGVSKKIDTALGMGMAVTFVMGLASAVCFVVNKYILIPLDLAYMQTVAFILVIASLVQFIEMFLQKAMPSLYTALGVYLPLITTNCCVLGVTVLNVDNYAADVVKYGFGFAYAESLICAAGAGFGFMLAMVLFSGVRKRVEAANCPECFKGLPITLVSASITSLSFMGFGGIIENIFGV